MRIHHLLALVFLLVAPLLASSCTGPAQQTGTLCVGESQPKPAELLPVSWAHAVYLPSAGVEVPAEVVDIAPDGVAELLITGLADTPDPSHPDAGATHPEAITITAPCLHFTGPAALQRPLGVAWAWPTDKAAEARAGAYAGTMADGSIRVAVGGDPVTVLTLPPLAVPSTATWIPDPSAKMGASASAWEAACFAP